MQNSSDEIAVLFEQALLSSKECSEIISIIDESLILLAQKRRTLEEKAIITHFHVFVQLYGSIITLLHEYISGLRYETERLKTQLNRLRTVNENLRKSVEELLKILKYNFNFLEQYFEYDYCAKLLNESEFKEDLQAVKDGLGV